MAITPNAGIPGLVVQGDVGDVQYYTDRWGRLVTMPAGPGNETPSALQVWQWDRWRRAFDGWRLLTANQKADYRAAARRLHLQATGPALWVYLCCRRSLAEWKTHRRASGLDLAPPVFV